MIGPRHQSHKVRNRNFKNAAARVAAQPPVIVSSKHGEDHSVFELDGRLRQVQEREISWKVNVTFADRDAPDLEALNNPVNQLGALHSECVPIVTSNDPVSYLAALNKRSNFMQDGPDDDITDEMFNASIKMIGSLPNLFSNDIWDENEVDTNEWLHKFDEGKKQRMRQARLALDETTIKDLKTKSGSVKIETLMGKRFDRDAAARIIYAGSDAFNALTGPPQMVAMTRLVQLLEHEVDGERLKVGGQVQVLLGYKADDKELAKFICDARFPEIVEGDFSRNDREQRSRVALICKAWMLKLGMPAWYTHLLDQFEKYSLVNFNFGVKIDLAYQLATGTTNTTFRNSIYNITMFAVTCQRQRRSGKCLVLGDDMLACLDRRLDIKAWVAAVADFKMVLKAKAPRLNGEATFLSRRLFVDVETPFMLPRLGKMLVRFNARANQNSAISDSTAMAAKALSYAYGCQNVHCLRDIFLERYEMEDDRAQVSMEDLGWNTRAFGKTPAQIKADVMAAPNLVDDDELSTWLFEVYEQDICDTLELFRDTILDVSETMLEDPRITYFKDDYE